MVVFLLFKKNSWVFVIYVIRHSQATLVTLNRHQRFYPQSPFLKSLSASLLLASFLTFPQSLSAAIGPCAWPGSWSHGPEVDGEDGAEDWGQAACARLRDILGAGQDPDGKFIITPSRTLLLSLKQSYRPPSLKPIFPQCLKCYGDCYCNRHCRHHSYFHCNRH